MSQPNNNSSLVRHQNRIKKGHRVHATLPCGSYFGQPARHCGSLISGSCRGKLTTSNIMIPFFFFCFFAQQYFGLLYLADE